MSGPRALIRRPVAFEAQDACLRARLGVGRAERAACNLAAAVKIERPQKTELIRELRSYVSDELDIDAGDLATELLLDFVVELVEPHIFNEALFDARAVASRQADALQEAIIELERVPRPNRGRKKADDD